MTNELKLLNALFDSGDIDKKHWKSVFIDLPDTRMPTCRDCQKSRNGSCIAQTDPLECFLYGTMAESKGILLNQGSEM